MVFMKHYAPNFNFTYTELVCQQNFTYIVVKLTQEVFFGIYSKVNQVIYSSLPIHS